MKLGIHLSSYTADWNDCGFAYIPHAARVGYEAVELPLMYPEDYDTRQAKKLLKEYHLSCTCGTGMNEGEDPSSENPEIRQKGIRRLMRCIDIASELETDCLGGVLYAPWGLKKPREEAAENYKWAADSLEKGAEYAGKKGITLSLEVLNRYESFFMNTVQEGLDFIRQIGRDNVKLHFDTFHAHIEEADIGQAVLSGGKHIFHVHLCDNNRCAPGSGSISFRRVREALEKISYDRYLMVENFILPNTEAGTESCIWRSAGRNIYENAQAAYSYLKEIF